MRRVVPVLLTAASFVAFPVPRSFAQAGRTLPPPSTVGEPLPPFTFENPGSSQMETQKDGTIKVTLTRDPRLGKPAITMGDVHLEADRIEFISGGLRVEAFGNVLMRRGDEELRGTSFVLQGDKGTFDADGATAVSPPFYIRAETISRIAAKGSSEFRARHARVTPSTNGRGEFGVRAEELRFINEKRVVLRNVTLYLWNNRLLTLRRLSFSVNTGSRSRSPGGSVPPVSFRANRISGVVLGAGLNFVPGQNMIGSVQVEATSKQGLQYAASVRADLFSYYPEFEPRRITAVPGGIDPKLANASPLRQFLAARALPPVFDPVLDFDTILLNQTAVSRPVRAAGRDVHLEFNVTGRREISGRRQGPLLLSKQPESSLVARFPLGSEELPSDDNASGRRFLHRLRPYILSSATLGKYEEIRLRRDNASVQGMRVGFSTGIGTMPMLIGDRLLLYGQVSRRLSHYKDDGNYAYTETSVAGSYIFGPRTAVGMGYTERTQSGASPFFWDQIDTRSEAQPFAQVRLPGGKYTIAVLGRYDMRENHLFDTEFALAIRGKNIEPRVSYRTLNSQLSFGVSLPGVSTR